MLDRIRETILYKFIQTDMRFLTKLYFKASKLYIFYQLMSVNGIKIYFSQFEYEINGYFLTSVTLIITQKKISCCQIMTHHDPYITAINNKYLTQKTNTDIN